MTVFIIVAVLMTAAALAFILQPLLRKPASTAAAQHDQINLAVLRDQLKELDADLDAGLIDQTAYEAARKEIERRVAEDVSVEPSAAPAKTSSARWIPAMLAVAVPVVAGTIYYLVGTPAGLDPKQVAASDPAHEVTQEQVEAMVQRLAARLESNPGDLDGWRMLARSYAAIGRYPESVKAYQQLLKSAPPDADILADYADTLAMTLGKTLQGEPEKLVEQALQADPRHVKALALYGSAAFERRDYASAVTRWQRILPLVPADSDVARSVQGNIGEAQQLAGMPITAAPAAAAPAASADRASSSSPAAASGATLQGTVDIDPALRAQASPNDTVFIFARAAEGPRFPLAVVRKQVKDLPTSFTLDDSMSMVPEAKLSSFPQVVVGARISKSGSATPAAGDLEGVSAAVAPGASNVKIIVSTRRQ
jgi:cytochrome c-type biogenesis protein CcmH